MTSSPSTPPVTDGWFAEVSPELFTREHAATPFDDFFSDVEGVKARTAAAASPIKLSPIHRSSPSCTAQGKRLRPSELDVSPPSTYLRIDQPAASPAFNLKWHAFSPGSPCQLMKEAVNEAEAGCKGEAEAGCTGKQAVDLAAVDGALLARPCLPPDMPEDVSDFVIDVRNSRLAATQMAALRAGRCTLLKWVYSGSTSELKGAFCDGVWFGQEELFALSMFRQ